MKRPLLVFYKVVSRSFVLFAISAGITYYATGIHPGRLAVITTRAMNSTEEIKATHELQEDLAHLDPSKIDDFEKIKALALEQRHLHADLTREFSDEDLKELLKLRENFIERLPQLESATHSLQDYPFLLKAISLGRSAWTKTREFLKRTYRVHIQPLFE